VDLERQLKYLTRQAGNNLLISNKTSGDYLLRSKVKGKVYQMNVATGEMVTPQVALETIGDDEKYLLEMQVEEYDIVAIQFGMPVLVVLNS
jgi:HlyD family secretion protein